MWHILLTSFLSEILKEFLVENEGNSTYLLDLCLSGGVSVDKVCCYGDGQFATKFLPPEP